MRIAAMIIIAGVALLHGYIAWFEIFAWETRGPNVFTTMDPEIFPQTVNMAANQGLYNAFLAAGLLWSLTIRDPRWHRDVAACFLIFVAVAGLFGAMTISPRIMMFQTLPAAIGLILLYLSRPKSA